MAHDDVFLSRVGHDLRGELATMIAGVHYLMRYEAGLGESGKQMLERVNGAGQRLRRLLDELELAVWIEGRPAGVLPREPCRLAVLAQAALGRLERMATQRNVTVRADLADGDDELEGDPELLGAALELVLDFAIARSPKSTVDVRADGATTFSVIDSGGAIDEASLARIFEPFFEKELVPRPEPGARRRERLGVGLAIARGIFAAYGGELFAGIAAGGRGIQLTCSFAARPPA